MRIEPGSRSKLHGEYNIQSDGGRDADGDSELQRLSDELATDGFALWLCAGRECVREHQSHFPFVRFAQRGLYQWYIDCHIAQWHEFVDHN